MTTQMGDPENVAGVRNVFDRWIAAIQSRNLEGVAAQHSPEVVMFDVPMPPREKIWYGYRPCSADGLPYIGRIKKYENV